MVGYATISFYFSHHLLTICFRGMSCAAMLLYTAMLDFTRKWDFTLSSETETQQLHWQTLPLVFRILTSSLALYLTSTTVFLNVTIHNSQFPTLNLKITNPHCPKSSPNFRDISWNVVENMILHEIFRVVSRFPRYISCYIAEYRFPLEQSTSEISFL